MCLLPVVATSSAQPVPSLSSSFSGRAELRSETGEQVTNHVQNTASIII